MTALSGMYENHRLTTRCIWWRIVQSKDGGRCSCGKESKWVQYNHKSTVLCEDWIWWWDPRIDCFGSFAKRLGSHENDRVILQGKTNSNMMIFEIWFWARKFAGEMQADVGQNMSFSFYCLLIVLISFNFWDFRFKVVIPCFFFFRSN